MLRMFLDCCCEGRDADLATGCWLSSLTQRWVTSAGKGHVPSLLQCAGTSARSDLTFHLSTAQNDHCQQRPEIKRALSSVSQALFAVSVTFQIFNINFNEVALFDKGQCCQHKENAEVQSSLFAQRIELLN